MMLQQQSQTQRKWTAGDGKSLILKNTFIVGPADDVPDDKQSPSEGRRRSEPSVLACIHQDVNFIAMLEGYLTPNAKPEESVGFHLSAPTEAKTTDDASDASDIDATVIAQTPENLTPRWEDSPVNVSNAAPAFLAEALAVDGEFARLFGEGPKSVSKAHAFPQGEANDDLVAKFYGKQGTNKTSSHIRSPSATSGKISHASTKSGLSGGTIASTLSCSSGASVTMMLDMSPLSEEDPTKTTVMARNIPPTFTRAMLTCLLDGNGFMGHYNFLYLPVDFGTLRSFGYAVINFVSHADALKFGYFFHGFKGLVDEADSSMSGVVEWSGALQGLETHVERYRDSPMMHPRVRDELKPMLFAGGQRVAFPPPTKVLKMPRRAKGETNKSTYIASPGGLISNAVGLAMTYTPLNQPSWQTPYIPDAAARAMRAISSVKLPNLPR
jgi:hypothetical protein